MTLDYSDRLPFVKLIQNLLYRFLIVTQSSIIPAAIVINRLASSDFHFLPQLNLIARSVDRLF